MWLIYVFIEHLYFTVNLPFEFCTHSHLNEMCAGVVVVNNTVSPLHTEEFSSENMLVSPVCS